MATAPRWKRGEAKALGGSFPPPSATEGRKVGVLIRFEDGDDRKVVFGSIPTPSAVGSRVVPVAGPDHQAFLRDLRGGRESERYVGECLIERGHHVKFGKHVEAATPYEGHKFAEEADLTVNGFDIIEVKGAGAGKPFTCRDDWPFRNAFVCAEHRWQTRKTKPFAFVFVSLNGSLLALLAHTEAEWTVETVIDRRPERGYSYRVLCAPLHLLETFDNLDLILHERERQMISYHPAARR